MYIAELEIKLLVVCCFQVIKLSGSLICKVITIITTLLMLALKALKFKTSINWKTGFYLF